jgi:hypothetical protein
MWWFGEITVVSCRYLWKVSMEKMGFFSKGLTEVKELDIQISRRLIKLKKWMN